MHHAYHHTNNHKDDPQDMRNMGGLGKYLPTTRWTYLAACGAIAGFPLMAGFFSKDEILWKTFSNANTLIPGQILWAIAGNRLLFLLQFICSGSYFLTFSGTFRSGSQTEMHLKGITGQHHLDLKDPGYPLHHWRYHRFTAPVASAKPSGKLAGTGVQCLSDSVELA